MGKKTPAQTLKDMGAKISVNGGAYVDPDSPEAEKQIGDMVKRGLGIDPAAPAPSDALLKAEEDRVDKTRLPSLFPVKGATDARLRSFVERVERLNGEVGELQEDIKELYGEAKANGYDPKIMRKIVRMRKMDVEKRQEEDALIAVYKAAVGLD